MKLFKMIAKIVLLPVMPVAVLLQWITIFLNGISGAIFGILSFLFAATGSASLMFGLASGTDFLKLMSAAFVLFLIPHIGDWLTERIALLRRALSDFIRL